MLITWAKHVAARTNRSSAWSMPITDAIKKRKGI
jgi:hypothetical protein